MTDDELLTTLLQRKLQNEGTESAGNAVSPPQEKKQTAVKGKSRRKPLASYHRIGAIWALLAALVIYSSVWILNGIFTVRMLTWFGTSIWIGWLIHLVASFIERHLWRVQRRSHYVLIIPIAFADVFSSAIGVSQTAIALNWYTPVEASLANLWGSVLANTILVVVALIIAIWPEPQIALTFTDLWQRIRKG